MASTNWNNITNTVLKGTIALSLITISGCVVPVTYKTYQALNDVQSVTKDVRHAVRSVRTRVEQVGNDDIDGILKSVRKLLDSLDGVTRRTVPAIENAIVMLLSDENIARVVSALDGGYLRKLIDIAYRHPGLAGLLESVIGVQPERNSLQESLVPKENTAGSTTHSESNVRASTADGYAGHGTNQCTQTSSSAGLYRWLLSWVRK